MQKCSNRLQVGLEVFQCEKVPSHKGQHSFLGTWNGKKYFIKWWS